MFASLGFQVDSAGLETFKSGLKQAKEAMSGLTSEVKAAKKPLEELKRKLTEVGKVKLSFGSASNSANLKSSIKGVNDQLDKIITRRAGITQALGKINSALIVGAGYWDRYRESVIRARTSLHNINNELRSLRANSNITVRVNRQDGGGGLGGGGGGGGGPSLTEGLLGLGAAKHFFGNFLPAAALATVAGSSGFIAKGAVNQGREQTKMETMLMMTAKSTGEFRDSLKYVREEALRLGLSSVELGKSFAQISMSAEALNQEQKKEMFTGFSEFMVAMGTNKDDQKGIFRAFNQMFGAGRILQEEINQLTERGIPATLIIDAAKQAYNTDDTQFIKKLQKDGKLDPNKVLLIMSKMVQQLAHDTGALDRMQQSSLYKQQVFMESLSQFSQRLMDSGLDVWLGDIFGKLTELVDVLEEVVGGVKGLVEIMSTFKSTLDEVTGGNSLLALALGFILLRFGKFSKLLRIVNKQMRAKKSITTILSTVMTGTFGKALGKIIGRFTLWTIGIELVLKGLALVNKAMQRRASGELTWIDVAIFKIEELGLWFRLVAAEAQLFFAKVQAFAANPITFTFGVDSPITDTGSGVLGKVFDALNPNPTKYIKQISDMKNLMDGLKGSLGTKVPDGARLGWDGAKTSAMLQPVNVNVFPAYGITSRIESQR